MSKVHARLTWIPKDRGGRDSPPPVQFVTPVCFERYKGHCPDKAWWSLVFDFSGAPENLSLAEVRLLVPERAPQDLLQPGSKFDVFVGPRLVASGEIVD